MIRGHRQARGDSFSSSFPVLSVAHPPIGSLRMDCIVLRRSGESVTGSEQTVPTQTYAVAAPAIATLPCAG